MIEAVYESRQTDRDTFVDATHLSLIMTAI